MSEQKFIPLSVPNVKGNALAYVTKAIREEWVSTSGGEIVEFEREFAAFLGVREACAVQSGTAALHLCMRHFGVGPGDLVLVPTLTFIATVNPVVYQGAEPVFFDCDEHLGIDVDQIERYLVEDCDFDGETVRDRRTGRRVKAIVPVHVFGEYADMVRLMAVAERFRLIVIEDATESLGTRMPDGRYTGTLAHAAAFSFNGNKIITTGGGGMVVSNDATALGHMRYLSQQAKDDAVYFVNNEVGYNYRMTNLQAALGRAQLEQLPEFLKIKRRNFRKYVELLAGSPYRLLPFRDPERSNCWFYSLLTGVRDASVRDRLIAFLNSHAIQSRPIWTLNHRQRPFAGFRALPTPRAEFFYDQVVNLPCSTNLEEADIVRVCATVAEFGRQ